MKLLMVSGDRQAAVGERGPFHSMQREFSRYFERVDVLCPRPSDEIRTRTIHGNVHLHPAPCGRLGMVNWIEGKGRELVARHAHGLITSHDYGWFYNGLGSARLSAATRVPYLSELHHVPGYPMAADLRERLDRAVARWYVGWARDRVLGFRVVNQEEMPGLLRRWGVPVAKIIVLPSLYVDLDVFRPAAGEVEPEQDVVFVGRMVANKRVERILGALARLAREGLPLRALLVGRGPRAAALRDRAARAGLGGHVRFVEWVDSPADLAEVYRRSRVCVCASTCEGGPRFTVEAMASGTPVVSTPVGVMGELLGDGAAGRLCGFDERALAEAIALVLSDEERRREMGRAAVQAARPFEYAAAIGNYARGLLRLAGEEAGVA